MAFTSSVGKTNEVDTLSVPDLFKTHSGSSPFVDILNFPFVVVMLRNLKPQEN